MIRFARDADLPALRALWQEAFEAEPAEAAHYFRHRHRHENLLLETIGDEVAGMLSMLPITLAGQKVNLPARYVFAVATFKKFRGLGVSTRLLTAAHEHMEQEGATAAVLVPATPSLFDYYKKRGYEALFRLDSLHLLPNYIPPPAEGLTVRPCGAMDYLRIRDAAFSSSGLFARWDEEAIRYMLDALDELEEGGALRLQGPQGEACCLYEYREGGVRLTELALLGLAWQDALSLIHQQLNAPSYTLRMPAGSLPGADTQPFGMIHWFLKPPLLSGSAPYLSLAKD